MKGMPKGSREEWYWCGFATHFEGNARCSFHLATVLPSGWLVSTLGNYLPKDAENIEPLGSDGRLYETMVFGCEGLEPSGNPIQTSLGENEMRGYQNSIEAERGHYELCEKYAEITRTKESIAMERVELLERENPREYTAEEFQADMADLDLNYEEMARLLGVHARQRVSDFARGKRKVPPYVAAHMLTLREL